MGSIKSLKKRYSGLKKYNRIVSTLVKDYKKRGESYQISDVRQLASSLYPNFKETALYRIKKRDILSSSPKSLLPSQRGFKKEPEYQLPSEFTDPEQRFYYDVADLLGMIETQVPNDVFFISQVQGTEGMILQGGKQLPPNLDTFYTNHFRNIVNYLDKTRAEGNFKDKSGGDFRIFCTPARPDKKNKRWISEIIITDSDGNPFGSYDFDPDGLNILSGYDPTEEHIFVKPKLPKEPTTTKKQTPTGSMSAEEIRVRGKEAENIEFQQDLEAIKLELFGDGTPEQQRKAFKEKWTKRGRFNS